MVLIALCPIPVLATAADTEYVRSEIARAILSGRVMIAATCRIVMVTCLILESIVLDMEYAWVEIVLASCNGVAWTAASRDASALAAITVYVETAPVIATWVS